MKNFLQGESYYLRKDALFQGICALFLIGSISLLFLIATRVGVEAERPLQTLVTIVSFSPFFYFILPIHACFFFTEGFEHGSIKNIIASGRSRSLYIFGKYISEIKVIIWLILQFFVCYYALFLTVAFITGAPIGRTEIREDWITVIKAIGFNILYLAAYSAVVMAISIFMKKTASALMVTFFFIFGDFMFTGYFQESSSRSLRFLSGNTMTSQILKFSGTNTQLGLPEANGDMHTLLLPLIIIAIFLITSIMAFEKRDIHI